MNKDRQRATRNGDARADPNKALLHAIVNSAPEYTRLCDFRKGGVWFFKRFSVSSPIGKETASAHGDDSARF